MLQKSVVVSLLALAPLALSAQTSAAARDEAATRAPSCELQPIERVTIAGDAERARLDSTSTTVAYWLRPVAGPAGRATQLAVRVGQDRAVEIIDEPGAVDSVFQRAARQAVVSAVGDHAFDRLAPTSAAPASYLVFIGRTVDGKQAKPATRRVCYAVARTDNPRMVFPPELKPALGQQQMAGAGHDRTMTEGTVRARFRVDSTGTVVPGSIAVVSSSDEAFTRELQRSLPTLRFYPATIDGRPLAQQVEQEFGFSLRY